MRKLRPNVFGGCLDSQATRQLHPVMKLFKAYQPPALKYKGPGPRTYHILADGFVINKQFKQLNSDCYRYTSIMN